MRTEPSVHMTTSDSRSLWRNLAALLGHSTCVQDSQNNCVQDYLTDLIVNRSIEYFRQKRREEPEKPILSFLSFPAPHGTEDAAPQYQDLYQNASSHM